jgi:hypothetical protein
MSTLAQYNNNPGNIRPAKGVKYEGLLGVDDKGFGIFATPEDGQKALVGDLTFKLGKRGIKTPSDFVDVYSPASEENSEESRDNYKIFIAQKLGLKSTDETFPENAVPQLAQAVAAFEGGTWNQPEKGKPSVAVPEMPPPAEGESDAVDGDVEQAKKDRNLNPVIGAGFGAATGVAGGSAAAVIQGKMDAAKQVYEAITNRGGTQAPVAPQAAPTADLGEATRRPAAASNTPGGKWGAKTGYGMGEGTVQESSSRYQRAMPKGKVSGPAAKIWGPALPGESPDVAQRMIDRAKGAETKTLADRMAAARAQQAALAAKAAEQSKAAEAAMLARQAEEAALAARKSTASPLMAYAKRLAGMPLKGGLVGAGIGFGGVDAYNRFSNDDNVGGALSLGATALGTAYPVLAPLSAATMMLYDNPEARQKMVDAIKPGGAYHAYQRERLKRRFGIDLAPSSPGADPVGGVN